MNFIQSVEQTVKENTIINIQLASRLLQEQGIRHVLVGTAGLMMYDHSLPGYEVDDVDFLVAKTPYVKEPLPKEACSRSDSIAANINGTKTDFVLTNFWSRNRRLRRYFTKNPTIIRGIPVASMADILNLKLSAARPKDFTFLAEWCKKYGEIRHS